MFGNAGAKPPTDASDPPDGSASAAAESSISSESGIASANRETVGHWLADLPERSWDETPGE